MPDGGGGEFGEEDGVDLVPVEFGGLREVVGEGEHDEQLPLPEGASLKTIVLQAPWAVSLPTPTVTFFHFGSDMRSFQGPVTLP